MQLLNRCETDIDVVFIDTVKVVYFCHCDFFPINMDALTKEVFCGARVEEIVPCLFDDVGGVDEKEEIVIPFLIEVENQPRHDNSLAATGRHNEQQMQRLSLAGKIIV